ncbi:MAG: FixH family protein [Amaricoccus sp.]
MSTLGGRQVFVIASLAFLTMLVPNVVLTVTAVKTFSGLVVPNSYVASQSFDHERIAQQALGWQLALAHDDAELSLAIRDATGHAVHPPKLAVSVGRPTTTRDDRVIVLEPTSDGYVGAARLAPGSWRVEIEATAADGTPFRQSRAIFVRAP